MNKNLSTFLFLFISFAVIGFENFQTDTGVVTGRFTVDKVIANDPVGLCQLDFIPLEYCQKVSLDLYGETFKKYAIKPDVPIDIPRESINIVKLDFHLGVDNVDYEVPTTGQLMRLIELGFVPRESGCYWIKKGEDEYASAGYDTDGCDLVGSIPRLVSSDFPTKCADPLSSCGLTVGP